MFANNNSSPTRGPRPPPRFGPLVTSPPNRQSDDDSVFDDPMNGLSTSRQGSMSYPPERPPFESNSNESNNSESNPRNNSPQIPLDNQFDPQPAVHLNEGFLP